jgi:O-acetyl-ADP-ribose deacetylase (regulator of RNase III)
VDKAAAIAVSEVRRFLDADERLERVTLTCFGPAVLEAYLRALQQPA